MGFMARRRFFVPLVREGTAQLTGDDARHLSQVLRVEPGQTFEISDNSAAYLAEVSAVRKTEVAFRVLERLPDPEPETPVHLIVAVFKFDRLEILLEKATELGATSIAFVCSERTERGLEKAVEKRMERWRRIATEASQQSRRLRTPELVALPRWRDAVQANGASQRLMLDEDRTGVPLIDALRPKFDAVSLLIGPEGGWTEAERADARREGWTAASMGHLILRAETAAIAALAVVNSVVRRSSSEQVSGPDIPGV
jgi:16S rRNA (uracil1498-N3)-methyltransferase